MSAVDTLDGPESEASAERLRETLSTLLGTTADKVMVDGKPTPMVARKEEGCIVISDVGELEPVDANHWCESESASVIAVVHDPPQGLYPYREHSAIAFITVRPDCPPYRVIKTLLDNGVNL